MKKQYLYFQWSDSEDCGRDKLRFGRLTTPAASIKNMFKEWKNNGIVTSFTLELFYE